MDNALLVRRLERVGDLPRDGHDVLDRNRTTGDHLREVLAIHELHHQRSLVAAAVRGNDLDAVDLCDVRMIERGERSCFAIEPGEPFAIGRKRRGKNLQRDVTAECRVARTIHLSHSTRAERAHDLVHAHQGPGVHVNASARPANSGSARFGCLRRARPPAST